MERDKWKERDERRKPAITDNNSNQENQTIVNCKIKQTGCLLLKQKVELGKLISF